MERLRARSGFGFGGQTISVFSGVGELAFELAVRAMAITLVLASWLIKPTRFFGYRVKVHGYDMICHCLPSSLTTAGFWIFEPDRNLVRAPFFIFLRCGYHDSVHGTGAAENF